MFSPTGKNEWFGNETADNSEIQQSVSEPQLEIQSLKSEHPKPREKCFIVEGQPFYILKTKCVLMHTFSVFLYLSYCLTQRKPTLTASQLAPVISHFPRLKPEANQPYHAQTHPLLHLASPQPRGTLNRVSSESQNLSQVSI